MLTAACGVLCRIPTEVETVQSAVDPLDPDTVVRLPLYACASPLALVLHPGEAVVIPQVRPCALLSSLQGAALGLRGTTPEQCGLLQGWWHYAVALDASITVMQNFYHAPTNAKGLLALVLQSLSRAKGVSPGQLLAHIRAVS